MNNRITFHKQFFGILLVTLLAVFLVSCNKKLKDEIAGVWIYQTLENGQITEITEFHLNRGGRLEEITLYYRSKSDEDGKPFIETMKSRISGTWNLKGHDLVLNYNFSSLTTEYIETVYVKGGRMIGEPESIDNIEKELHDALTTYYNKENGKPYQHVEINGNIMQVGSEEGQLFFIRYIK